MKNRILFVIIIFSILILTSCGGAPSAEEPAVEEPAAEEPMEEPATEPEDRPPKRIDELYVLEEAIWESNIINVCWENPDQNNQADRDLIQAAIEETWDAASLVDFIGWGICQPEATGIRIQINDESPHTKGLGTNIDGLLNGMVLNTTFNNWGCVDADHEHAPCIFPYNGYSREDLIRMTAVHEFGHALGFAHEQNRDDTPSWCDQPHGAEGTMPIGGWDLDSVMNYCNPNWIGNGELSEMDILGMQTVYGAAPLSNTNVDKGFHFKLKEQHQVK